MLTERRRRKKKKEETEAIQYPVPLRGQVKNVLHIGAIPPDNCIYKLKTNFLFYFGSE